MAKKIRRTTCCGTPIGGRSLVRTASKSMEKKLLQNANQLYENPHLVLPEYSDPDSKKGFIKVEKQLSKVESCKDDVKKLEKLSKKKNLAAAVAGTLLIAHAKKAPFLAAARLPIGEVTYAQRGNASKESLIATQHFDDPFLRLLGIKDVVLKRRLHVYSWDKGYVSTGIKPQPPEDFIRFVMDKIKIPYKNKKATCRHLSDDIISSKKLFDTPYILVHWKSADVTIAVCKECTKSTKNMVFTITKYLIEPEISTDFHVNVVGGIIKEDTTAEDTETAYLEEYFSGRLTDHELIIKNMRKREEELKTSAGKQFILNGVSYGDNVEGFVEALKPKPHEKKGLLFILEKIHHPIIVNDVTPNAVLEQFWDDHGFDLIQSIVEEKTLASDLLTLDDSPSEILRMAYEYKERKAILSQLPSYAKLPSLAAFADHIARTYRTFGKEKALSELNKTPGSTKARALSYAFLLALEKAEEKKWKYSDVEIESGEFLQQHAKTLLDAPPEQYHTALKTLISATGASEKIDDFLQQ